MDGLYLFALPIVNALSGVLAVCCRIQSISGATEKKKRREEVFDAESNLFMFDISDVILHHADVDKVS